MASKASNKRRPDQHYQPAITSFFYSASSGSLTKPSIPLPGATPRLPASTQQSLLDVGMRVRKSIAEGYKTTTTAACEPSFGYGYTRAGASVREAYYNPAPPSAEEPESIPNSQESFRKRRMEDSDSDDDDDYNEGEVQMGGISTSMLDDDGRMGYVGEEQSQWQLPPTTFLPHPDDFVPGRGGPRHKISPKPRMGSGHGRRSSFHMSVSRGIPTFGNEDGGFSVVPGVVGGGGGEMDVDMSDDFGEASFLRPVTEFGR